MSKIKVSNKLGACVVAAALMIGANPSRADEDENPAVEYRRSVMVAISWNANYFYGLLRGTVKYDAEQAQMRANNLKALSTMSWEAFTPESKGDPHSWALPLIWEDPEGFKAVQLAFKKSVVDLDAAAGNGPDAAKAATKAMASMCSECHDTYKMF